MSQFPFPQFRISNLSRVSLIGLIGSAQAADKITYDDHVFPIFESKCLNCHNPDKKKGDLDLSTYMGTMTGSSGGKIVLAGDGGSSKLFTVTVHTEEPVMPPEGDKIPKKDADLIRAWIDGGLLENSGSKAKKRQKPAFSLGAVPSGKRPEGPPPMPQDLLLEPVISPTRATVVGDMDASPWAPLLAVTGQRQVLLYNTDTLELVGILPFPKGQPETLSFHPSGKYLLAGGGIAGKSGTTVTWEITTGKVMMTMGKEFDSVLAADLRADLGGVALGGPSRLVKLWDTQEAEQINSIKKHTDWVTALAYSHDGVLLATGDRNNGVQIWEAATGNEFHSLRGHQKAIVDIKWRADSNLIASASEDDTIRFWDMNQGKEIKKPTVGGGGILAMDYAANGRLVSASRDRRVRLWKPNLSKDKQSEPFPELVTEVAFSHDAARYFTADWNGKIEVWETKEMKKIGELSANPQPIRDRLASLIQEKKAFDAGLASFRQKLKGAENDVKAAQEKLAKTEAQIRSIRAETAKLQKEANDLELKRRKRDASAKAKETEKNTIAKKAPDPAQQQQQLIQQRRKLAAQQQRLTQSHSSANQALISASRNSAKKRDASNKEPNNEKKKAALVTAEQAEHQQRQIVGQLTGKLAAHKKVLAEFSHTSKTLKSGVITEDKRIKALAQEQQKLIAQRDEIAKAKTARLATMKAKLAKIPEIEKQIQPQRSAIAAKEERLKTAKEELKRASGDDRRFDARIKELQAALINAEFISAKQQLSTLNLRKERDPSLASQIEEQKKRCELLLTKYQSAKN